MKSATAGMIAHIAGGTTTLAEGFKVTRADGLVLACTSHDVSDTIDGVLYSAYPGIDVTEIATSVGTGVGTLELVVMNDGALFSTSELLNGLWRNAEFELFRYNWASIADGEIPLMSGRIGESTLRDKHIAIELRDLRQYLQQDIGKVSTKTCPYRVGDARCTLDLDSSDGPFTVVGSITGVTSNRIFQDSGRGEAADWFGEGSIEFTTGANQGVKFKVRSYAADGTFTLSLPVFSNVEVGDQYIAIVGCRGRFEDDCVTKFSAYVPLHYYNFGGQPHRKGFNGVVQIP